MIWAVVLAMGIGSVTAAGLLWWLRRAKAPKKAAPASRVVAPVAVRRSQRVERAEPPPRRPEVVAKPKVIIDVRDEDIAREIRENRLMNAIALYREKNGVGVSEARLAVVALRDRMRAS